MKRLVIELVQCGHGTIIPLLRDDPDNPVHLSGGCSCASYSPTISVWELTPDKYPYTKQLPLDHGWPKEDR